MSFKNSIKNCSSLFIIPVLSNLFEYRDNSIANFFKSNKVTKLQLFSEIAKVEILEKFIDDIDLFHASNNPNLTIDFVRDHKDNIEWWRFSRICSLDILEEFENKIDWYHASKNKNLSDDLIRRHYKELNWSHVSFWCSLEILEEFHNKINWISATTNPNLTIKLAEEKLEFNSFQLEMIARYGSIHFVNKYIKWLPFKYISCNPNLTLDFVRVYKDELNWEIFSRVCSLEVMKEFNSLVNIDSVSQNSNLSLELLMKFYNNQWIDKINWKWISQKSNLDILEEFETKNKLDFDYVSRNENLDISYLKRNQDRLILTPNIFKLIINSC